MKMLWSIMANRVEMKMGPDGLSQGFPLATKALPFLYCFPLWRGKVIITGSLGAKSMVQFDLAFILAFLVTFLCHPTVCFLWCWNGKHVVTGFSLWDSPTSKSFVSGSEFICNLMFDNINMSQYFPFVLC